MLRTLRENPFIVKGVLWAVVLVMVAGIGVSVTSVYDSLVQRLTGKASGTPDGPWVMVVAGETVTPMAYQNEVRNISRQFSAQGQTEFPGLERMIEAQAEARLRERLVMLQEARKAGLTVSDKEVSAVIVSQFQRDGRFIGRDQYQALLRQNDMEVTAFENQTRQDILLGKFVALVGAGAVVTDREVEDEYKKRNEKVRIDHLVADLTKFQPTTLPTDAEVKTYYDAHPDKYNRGEGRRARYFLIDEKTAGPVAQPNDEEMKKAQAADPAKYPGTFEQSREEIRRQMLFQRQQAAIDLKAREILSTASAGALDEAASKAGARVEDTGIVYQNPDGLSRLGPEFIDAMFKAPKDLVMGPAKMVSGTAVYMVTELQPPHRASIAEARLELLTDINKDKSKDAALAAARRAVGSAGGDLGNVAKAVGGTVKNGSPIGRTEPPGDFGYDPTLMDAIFAAQPGQILEPRATSNGSVVVVKVVEHKAADPSTLGAMKETIRADLRRNRETQLMNSILTTALNKPGVYKRNDQFFRSTSPEPRT